MLFRGDIRSLDDALAPYLEEKDDVWLLVDNLDKGSADSGARSSDILILRTLLEATRKLQRQFEQRGVEFHCLVFLRNDIYEHLILETPDRGKETAINLDWDDPEVFKEIIRQRVRSSTNVDSSFDTRVVAGRCPPHRRGGDLSIHGRPNSDEATRPAELHAQGYRSRGEPWARPGAGR